MSAVGYGGVEVVSGADCEFYLDHGYFVGPKVLDDDRIAQVREAAMRVYRREFDHGSEHSLIGILDGDDPAALKTILNTWWVNDVIAELVHDPMITSTAAKLMSVPSLRVWQDQIIWKPPSPDSAEAAKSNIGYHQDYAYWQDVSTTNMLTANIALQDNTEFNGAMRVLSGSHTRGVLDPDNLRAFGSGDLSLANRLSEFPEITLEVKAGHVTFHHSLTMHGSGPNTSGAPRFAVAIAYMPGDATYRAHDGVDHPNSRYLGPRPAAGMRWEAPSFPLVFPNPDVPG